MSLVFCPRSMLMPDRVVVTASAFPDPRQINYDILLA